MKRLSALRLAAASLALMGTQVLAQHATTSPVAPAPASERQVEERRPNFLIIVADDLGFSDIGAFGGEIATPNLDALALRGVRFTDFHTAPTCSPTRSMLLSGTDNHRAGLGTMAELIAPNQRGKPGHEGYLRAEVAALPEILGANGYRTILSGKWHLGLAPEQDPHARGFQHTFTLLQGAHNHFGQDPAGSAIYRLNGEQVQVPEDFYSSDYFATRLIDFLGQTDAGADGDKPFFAYLAFTAPHWPLQALPEDIARYRGRYDAGYDLLREQRFQRQVELGLVDPNVPRHQPDERHPSWDSLSPETKATAARDMEIYAAMVERLDTNVGRVIETLKASGDYDNTVIVFLADNGAEGMAIDTTQLRGIAERVAQADNTLENRGAASSYLSYGPGWALAATAPSWLYKAYATEGGTRTVSFVSGGGFERAGTIGDAFLSVQDVVPTFLDLAGVPDPEGQFEGRTVEPIRGKSWVNWLEGESDTVYAADEAVGTELFASRAIRQGDWKITDPGDGVWRLFNLADDPGETRDLSVEEPERLQQLIAQWNIYAADVGVVLPEAAVYRP